MLSKKKIYDGEEGPPKRVLAETLLTERLADLPDKVDLISSTIDDMGDQVHRVTNEMRLLRSAVSNEMDNFGDKLAELTETPISWKAEAESLRRLVEEQRKMISSLAAEVSLLRSASCAQPNTPVLASGERGVSKKDLDRLAVYTDTALRSAVDDLTSMVRQNANSARPVDAVLERLAKLEKQLQNTSPATSATVAREFPDQGSLSALQISARLVKLESSISRLDRLASSGSPAPAPQPAATGTGRRKDPKNSVEAAHLVSPPVPASAPVPSRAAAPAPTPAPVSSATVDRPWVIVAGRRVKTMTKEAIAASVNPVKDLLVHPRADHEKTTAVFATVLKAKFAEGVRQHPFAAWKSLLRGVTGKLPLNITMMSSVQCEVYWDVSARGEQERLVAALKGEGLLATSSLESTSSHARRARSYQDAYFSLLRRAALEGLDEAAQRWVLDKVAAKWQGSKDKASQRIWKRRIEIDRRELGLDPIDAAGGTGTRSSWMNPDETGFAEDPADEAADQCPDSVSAAEPGQPNVPSVMDEGEE